MYIWAMQNLQTDSMYNLFFSLYFDVFTLYLWFAAVRGSNLQVNEVTNHSAIFSWEISHPNIGCNGKLIDHDTQFRVRYKEVDDSESWRRINLKNTSAKLPNLLPFTNYTVYVLTADQSGPNQKSDDLFFTTLPGGMHL